MRSPLKATALLAASAVSALALAACGGSTEEPVTVSSDYDCSQPDNANPTSITVVGMPILSNGALYVGVDQGLFEKHGLDAQISMVPSPPAAASAVVGGSADFAFGTTMGLLQAVEQGQDLRGVAPFAGIEPGFYDKMQAGEAGYETGINALLVQDGSGIESPRELEGKTVAVADAALSELLTKARIKMDGGDPDKVKFVVMTGPDAYNAVIAGKVDAAQSFQPIIQGFEAKGLRNLSWLEVEVLHDGPTSLLISTSAFVRENQDVVARFNCAIREAATYSNAHQDEVRAVTAREQKVDPATLESALVPYFYTEIDTAGVERIEDLMVDLGFLREKLAEDDVLVAVEGS